MPSSVQSVPLTYLGPPTLSGVSPGVQTNSMLPFVQTGVPSLHPTVLQNPTSCTTSPVSVKLHSPELAMQLKLKKLEMEEKRLDREAERETRLAEVRMVYEFVLERSRLEVQAGVHNMSLEGSGRTVETEEQKLTRSLMSLMLWRCS
ncbi:hypothetical protein Pcinc_019396 [Petrolisthes cinctipes]|uniref:Uncharacterized protein n=1 Tax=Petrolisthes cinctipes TaxID=88211 RepID=A0AAE1FK75_PETCI|nr:hypothetical protein Pcinc_019396 [Petrolisthes cinctipes]